VNALFKAIEYWKQHQQEANGIMAPHFQVDKKRYTDVLEGLRFCDINRNRQYFGTILSRGPIFEVAERASAIWTEARVISTQIKPASLISVEFVN
jgi:NitT/TauT family transport system substrate-binding protein